MSTTLTPFDPDSISQGCTEAPAGMMLSDLLARTPEAAPELPTGAVGPGTSAPLDKRAKWQLSELAEATHDLLTKSGELAGETLAAFRQRVAIAACGKRISQACLGDRMLIQSAFLKLKGSANQAARAQVKAATTALDIARHKLGSELRAASLSESYAEGISRRIYKRPICALTSPKQVWTIIFTVKNNANARDGKGRKENRFKSLRAKRQTSPKNKSL